MPPQNLEFSEAENHADTDDIDEDAENDRKKPTQQDKGSMSSESRRGCPKLSEDLPREHVMVDVADSDKVCTCCQSALCKMDESTSEKLVYLPAKLYVEVTERPKYVCRQCDTQGEKNTVVMAPPSIIHYPKKHRHTVSAGANHRQQIPLRSASLSTRVAVRSVWYQAKP